MFLTFSVTPVLSNPFIFLTKCPSSRPFHFIPKMVKVRNRVRNVIRCHSECCSLCHYRISCGPFGRLNWSYPGRGEGIWQMETDSIRKIQSSDQPCIYLYAFIISYHIIFIVIYVIYVTHMLLLLKAEIS